MRAEIKYRKQKYARAARSSGSVAALALALGTVAAPTAQAQQITQGGGGAAGGIAGGGGGNGGSGMGGGAGRGGTGGSGATTPGGLAQDGAAGSNVVRGGAGGQAGTPNDISAGGGGGGGGGGGSSIELGGNGGTGGSGGRFDPTGGAFSLAADYLGASGGDGTGGLGGGGGGGGGSGALVLTGTAVDLTTNGYDATGGSGGSGLAGGGISGSGGGGGAGLVLLDAGVVTVTGGSVLAGGNGGNQGSVGGFGGAGLFLHAGGALSNQAGDIRGGNGGGTGLSVNTGGGGGAGVLSNLGAIGNEAAIEGGAGGYGNTGGGRGGAALVAWGGSVENSATGTISGGRGGATRSAGTFFRAGDGGAGVLFRDGQAAGLTNSGTIEGGAGGATPFGDNVIGVGGVAVVGAATGNISIVNSGTIVGGVDSRSATRSDAIALFGDGNRLELRPGSVIAGNVVASGGSDNALALGGASDAAFDVSLIGSAQQYRGFDRFEKTGSGSWTLTGSGDQDWFVASGALRGDTNSLSGNVTFATGVGSRSIVFDQGFDGTYGGTISGAGTVTKTDTGVLTVEVGGGGSDFTGTVEIEAGTLVMNGRLGDGTGNSADFRVGTGARLGGSGTILGHVIVADGGIVGPGASPGTLTIAGDLALGAGSILDYEFTQSGVVGGGVNDLVVVGGDLTLDGRLDATALAGFGAGYFRLIDYGGALIDNGLEVGATPPGYTGTVQTGIAGQVNILFNDGAQQVQYWDGADAAGGSAAANGDGGAGVWRAGGTNWTAGSGFGVNGGWAGQAGIFAGNAGGTVAVEGIQSFQLLRFDTAGYALQGGALATTGGFSIVEVNAAEATIGSAITGIAGLTKTGAGVLVLSGGGTSFTGRVEVEAGTLLLDGVFGDGAGNGADLRVGSGARLGGSGTFLGDVGVADGGILGPGNGAGSLDVAGDLTLGAGSVLDYEFAQSGVVGGGINDLVVVGGDLTLDGTLNVTALADFGSGYFRLIDYAGALTDNGLELGTTPLGYTGTIQTGIAGQVNILFNDGAQRVQYWDGADAAGGFAAADGDGGAGVWRAGGTNWTAATGFGVNDAWAGQAGVFAGIAGGTVTVEDMQSFQLLRFDTAGYALQGGALATTGGFSIVEVNAAEATIGSAITGSAGLTKTGAGTLTLSGANSYAGLTTVGAGTLSLAAGGSIAGPVQNDAAFANAGTVSGLVTNDGTLASTGTLNGGLVNRGTATLAGQVDGTIANDGGTIALTDALSGVTRLDQAAGASFDLAGFEMTVGTLHGAGSIVLGGGTLAIGKPGSTSAFDGTIAGSGAVMIAGGSFQGSGTIDAAVTVADGARLVGAQGRTLSMGSLVLGAESQVDVTLGAPSSLALFDVGGDFTLDGTLDVTATSAFGAGVYRLFDYGGTLTDNGMELGTIAGASADSLSIQTSAAGQVNLVETAGATLTFWDGGDPGLHNNGAVDGGSGTWGAGGTAWTTADGGVNGVMSPQPGFAVFQGSGGMVTIDNEAGQASVTGMQFAVDGYTVSGGDLALSGDRAAIRVGDGTAAGAAFTARIGASLTGSATLVKTDLGTLVLTGSNTYSGGTVVEAGTLVGDTEALRRNFANNGTLIFDLATGGTYSGTVTGTGKTIKSGGGVLTLTGANATDWEVANGSLVSTSALFTGDVDLARDTSFVFDQAGEGAYAGTITGSGAMIVRGGGAIRFEGDGSGFRGTTSVGQGQTLAVNGALGGTLDVAAGGRLQGTGKVDSGNVAGTIAPGNSIGTLTFTGNLALASGSSYEVEADPAGSSDRIIVGGAATIESHVEVNVLAVNGNYAANTSYTILTAAGGVTGTFATVTSNLAFLTPTLTYAANAVMLNLRRNTVEFGTVGETVNQRAVAPSIEVLGAGNDVYDAVVALTAPEARNAFDQLAGSDYASVRGQLLEDGRFVRDAMLARGETAGTTGMSVWGRVIGSWGSKDRDPNGEGYDRDLKGLLTGFDSSLGEHIRAGVALGYGSTDLRSARAEHDIDAYHAGGYMIGSYGMVSVQLGGAYTWNDVHASRRVAFGTLDQTLSGDYSARTFQAFGEVALKGELGGVILQPFAALAHLTLSDGEVNELGGSAALQGGNGNESISYGTLGVRTRANLDVGALGLRFAGSAAVRHAFGDRAPTIDLAFASGPAFIVSGTAIERNSITVDAGLEADLGRNITFGVSYSGNYGDRSTDHGAHGSFSWRF
ncbi:autotransporter outer membrane beta-barrel domain-containing protein [Sphingosinicella sp. CPCC 101087]|uniref:autotransporter outer membrane beta-barrel domain-containing protein n=1 Tax=Sphingosinicella sp. CPCC 101087 TaxID=2497754 RepID=UPI0013EC755C|nr:autotransporter outer membrane beta-barrel domain-containing protein [Sphingosinicella sp. CPCC 101087]